MRKVSKRIIDFLLNQTNLSAAARVKSRELFLSLLILTCLAAVILSSVFWRQNSLANERRTELISPAAGQNAAGSRLPENAADRIVPKLTTANYAIDRREKGAQAANAANRWQLNFDAQGLRLNSTARENNWDAVWNLMSFGLGGNQTAADKGKLSADGNRLEIKREKQNITEWFVNESGGIEHGFTLFKRPKTTSSNDENLRLVMKTGGDLTAQADADGQKLTFVNAAGKQVLSYEKLKVWDANGKDLTARMQTGENGGEVWLEVEDQTAVYPLTVDPTFVKQEADASETVSLNDFLSVGDKTVFNDFGELNGKILDFRGNRADDLSLPAFSESGSQPSKSNNSPLNIVFRVNTTVPKWLEPYNYEQPASAYISIDMYLSATNGENTRLDSISVNVKLPPHLEFDRGVNNGSGVTVTGSGQNVSLSMSGGYSGANFYAKTVPYAQLPVTPQSGEVKFTGTAAGPSGTYTINEVKPTYMFYTKPKWSRLSQGVVFPNDEVPFQIETQNYPHAASRSATLKIYAPAYTDFVEGSFTGLDNAIVTDSSTSYNGLVYKYKKLDWGTSGTNHTVGYKLKISPTVPANVTKIELPSGVLNNEYEWSIPPALGRRERVLPEISLDVEHRDVGLEIILPETPLAKGDEFAANVKVTSYRNDKRTITFADPLLKEQTLSGNPDDRILTLEPPKTPAPFELNPQNPTRTFSVPVKVNKLGVTNLVSSLSFTGPGGISGTVTETKKVEVSPLRLTLDVTPEQPALNHTNASSKTADCLAHEAHNSEIKNCIELTAKVKNDTEKTIRSVKISGAEDALDLIESTDFENPGVPLTAIDYHPPHPGNFDLAPGEEAIFTWHVNAFDAPAKLVFTPVAYGVLDGVEVGAAAKKNFKILDKVLLKWGMRPTDGRTTYVSGQNVRADGYIENVSAKDGGAKKLLRVIVYQIPKKNLGGGFVFPATYSGPSPTQFEVFDLPAEGDGKRLNIKSVLRSFKIDFSALGTKASGGDVEFGVRLRIVEDDGTLTTATDQVLLDEDYVDHFSVSFSPDAEIYDEYVQDCLNAGFMPILCSFNQSLSGESVDGIYGLIEFSLYSLEKTGEGTVRTGAYSLWAMHELMKVTFNDPQAKQALMQDMYVQYLTFYNLGVMSGQVAGQAPMVFEAFSLQAGDAIGHYMNAIERGDLHELQVQTGHFLGANPDLLFEPFVVGRSFANMAKSLRRAGGGLAENVFTAAARAEAVQRAASVETRVAEAASRGEDLATALVAGDVLKPSLMAQVFGVSHEQVQRLLKFANENEVILAFRSRHPRSQVLLDALEAYPKPQAFKQKTVNLVDINFLGYRREAEATIEIVEPPVGIAGKEGAELKTAIDAYMDVLAGQNPALSSNRVLRDEVRERLEGRAKEWNKYAPQLKLNNLDEPVHVGVNFGAGDQFVRDVSGDVGVKEFRKVERNRVDDFLDPVTGTNRRRWEIKMEGPNGAAAKPITGDIDFLGILDKYGRLIRDDNKRIALYHQMQEFMEHGESMSYRYEDLRQTFVRCCVEGKEAMMTVGPWGGEPRAGHFVDNLSVMDDFNADFKRVRGTEPALGPAGELLLDAEGKPAQVTLRHEDPTGEFSLINGTPLLNNPNPAFVKRFAPLIFETVFNDFKKRIPYYFPSILARILNDDNLHRRNSSSNTASTAIFRRGAPLIQAAGVSEIDLVEPDALRVWTLQNGWQPITREQAIALGDPNLADVAPNSSLTNSFAAGTTDLTITPASELSFEGDFFSPDDTVVINPGGANQETAIIKSINPIVLKDTLIHDHNPSEMIAVISSGAVGTPTPTPTPTVTPTPTPTPTATPTPTPTPTPTGQSKTLMDFDGDGKADASVYRPSDFSWYALRSTAGFLGASWGASGDQPAPADYDGDGKTDLCVFRQTGYGDPNKAYFFIFRSSDKTVQSVQFGRIGDDPSVTGDWDGDGKADPAVFRGGANAGDYSYFYYHPSSQPAVEFVTVSWGTSGDKPVAGDYDGDGRTDAAVFRPSDATWYVRKSSDGGLRATAWGLATDKLIVRDFDGDGKTDLAVYRGGDWYILQSSNNQFRAISWGLSTDTPAAADYDGDGRADAAVYRKGWWYILRSSDSQLTSIDFGNGTDTPLSSLY